MAVHEIQRGKRYLIDWLDEFRRRHRLTVDGSRTEASDVLKGKRAEIVKRRRDLRRLSEGLAPRHADSMPTFSDFVADHFMKLYRGKHGIRSTYYADVFSEGGAILTALGDVRIDRITRERLEKFRRAREAGAAARAPFGRT